MGEKGAERRRETRMPVADEIGVIEVGSGETLTDLSPGGVFVVGDRLAPLGTEVRVRLSLLTEQGIALIAAVGEVVHHGEPDRPGMGVQFVDLDPEVRRILEQVTGEPE